MGALPAGGSLKMTRSYRRAAILCVPNIPYARRACRRNQCVPPRGAVGAGGGEAVLVGGERRGIAGGSGVR